MKIILLNTSEQIGGAAIACKRLLLALRKSGVDAKMLVRDKQTKDPHVISVNHSYFSKKMNKIRFLSERIVIYLKNKLTRKTLFSVSIANTGNNLSLQMLVKEADVIHIHWINQGFLSLENIKSLIASGKPIVWTMHDMWPCTGICHHAYGCNRYEFSCGKCPFLESKKEIDLSYKVFQKKRFLSTSAIQIVTVSTWLKQKVEKSALTQNLNISVIPNMIDVSVFIPSDKKKAREQFSFSQTKKIILMGAAKLNDPIKGFEYLQQSLLLLKKRRDDILLVLFGKIKKDASFLSAIPVEFVFMDLIQDTAVISQLYAAADVTVVPSMYETFGQTIMESMACGCPVVSFDNSGQTDIIDHKINGYLAKYKDVEDLAKGIQWVLKDADYESLSKNAINKVRETYDESVVVEEYTKLYNKIISK